MIDPYVISAIAIFLIGTILLTKTSAKRYIIFFMIHTKHGLRLVDKIANLSPSLWKFLGDLAIVVSFGGLGSLYVSRYKNTWLISLILGLVACIFTYMNFGIIYTFVCLVAITTVSVILKWRNKPILHFLVGSLIMGIIMFNIYPNFSSIDAYRPLMSALVGVFGVPALLVSMLFLQASKIVVEQSMVPGVSPLLPTVTDEGPGFFFPGTGIFIPFWQALIAILFLLVPHEFAHGILTRSQGIKLKSAGILTAGPVPVGAFVEPDSKDMEKHKGNERMRMYAAGSFTNIITSLIALMLILFVVAPFSNSMTVNTGMEVLNVVDGSPAYGILENGFVVTEIGGIKTLDTESFYSAVENLKPGQSVKFVTSNGTFDILLGKHPTDPERGYIGIDLKESFKIKEEFMDENNIYISAIFFITPTLFWIFFICFNVALVNLLPIIPFDGGKMFEEYMEEFGIKKKKREIIQKGVVFIIVLLLLVNASPLIFMLF